jgi:hypothetical protein
MAAKMSPAQKAAQNRQLNALDLAKKRSAAAVEANESRSKAERSEIARKAAETRKRNAVRV